MGAGKTKFAKIVARELDLPFVDSDDEIENAAGMKIAEIFERFGEDYFRDGERRIFKRLVSDDIKVIATGGGAVMTEQTADLIWNTTLSVWIKSDINDILNRTKRNIEKRPLLMKDDPKKILMQLAELRYPVYGKADIVVENIGKNSKVTVNKILEQIEQVLNQ